MDRLTPMIRNLDTECSRILDRFSPVIGAPVQPDYTTDTRNAGFMVSRLILAYALPESLHSGKQEVLSVILETLDYLRRNRRPSGCFDLITCNFDTAPDTAFTLNQLSDVYAVLSESDAILPKLPGLEEIRTRLLELIERGGEGILSGGFHTPNHRWAISAALKEAARLCNRTDFDRCARRYLCEGLDINADGEFAERSAGTYNVVNDEQMIRLYLLSGNTHYLDAARSNLTMMLHYFEPDGSIFTLNSTRQDFGHKIYPAGYFILYLLTGYLSHDPTFAAWANRMWEFCDRAHITPYGLPWLLRFPELQNYVRDLKPDPAVLERYSRLYASSGIARWRRGDLTCTALQNRPDFLHVMHHGLALTLAIYSNVCDKRNFMADLIVMTEKGCHLSCRMDSWYYLPFDGNGPTTCDWWAMDNARNRRRQIRDALTTDIDVEVEEDGVCLHFRWSGLAGVPIRLEFGFSPGHVRGSQFYLEGEAGKALTVTGGCLEVTDDTHGRLTLDPAFGEHNLASRMGGAYPLQPDRFTVLMTTCSPAEKTVRIGTSALFPPTLP
ncbi:MAG: hypothetical protein IJ088_00815 [Clostridia bacterium]|nr:hypothetical protein [Clostridia bacterium]